MSGVHGVLNYAGCFTEAAESVDRVNGWETGLLHSQTFVVPCGLGQSRSHTKRDTARKNAFYGASVKAGESCS